MTVQHYERKLHQMYHNLIKVDEGYHVPYTYLFGVSYSNASMKQRFMTSMTGENRLIQTWFDSDQDINVWML